VKFLAEGNKKKLAEGKNHSKAITKIK